METISKTLLMLVLTAGFAANGYAHDGGIDGSSVIGGAIGGGAGAAVGSSIGGRNGAILGSAVGAAAGVAIATPQPKAQVIEHRYYDDGRRYHRRHDNGRHRGHYKHHHDD